MERNHYILRRMIRNLGARTLSDLTGPFVIRWCSGADSPQPLANNTIRGGSQMAVLDRAGALLD